MSGKYGSPQKALTNLIFSLQRKFTTSVKALALPAILVVAVAGPIFVHAGTANADTNCSTNGIALAGSSWLGGGGVNVCNHPGDGSANYVNNVNNQSTLSGYRWQCVEMVNRLYLTKGWITSNWYGNGGGSDGLIHHLPSNLTDELNGSISYINPSDVITLNNINDPNGHTAIINSVSGSTYNIINQNAQLNSSAYIQSGTLSGGNVTLHMNYWAGYTVQAVVHAPAVSPGWGGVGNAIYSGGDSMASGTTLLPGYYLTSANVQNALVFQTDSNLVLYAGNGTVLWQSGTGGQSANRLVMQSDGNLVMYRADNSVVWQSFSGGHSGSYANLQSDGNFLVRDSGSAYWWTGTGGHANLTYFGSDRLTGGQSITQNQYIRSSDGRYALMLETNGNVVLYSPGYHPLWQSNTGGAGDTFTMQTDGNLVLYALGTARWWTGTSGSGVYAVMQSDGNFVVYNSANFPLWTSGTGGQI